MCPNRITVMHCITLTLSLTCFIMHFTTKKWGYEYQFDPLFNLTFIGCSLTLLTLILIDALRLTESVEPNNIAYHDLFRVEIVFDIIAFFLYVACGTVNLIYDVRPVVMIKAAIAIINGICFFLDALICSQCQYRWGHQVTTDYVQRMNERQAFAHMPYSPRMRYL